MSGLDISGRVDLLEWELLKQEAFIKVLRLVNGEMLLEQAMWLRHSESSHLCRWVKVEFLGNAHKTLLFCSSRQVNTWDSPNPNFIITNVFNERNVSVVGATMLDANPLVNPQLTVLRLIVLINNWHLLSGHQNVPVENEVKAFASLPHMSLFECFHKDVSLRRVTASHR